MPTRCNGACGATLGASRCPDFRNKLKFFEKLRKHHNTNPKRGPFHFRAPSRILYHTVRGMIPHKTARGKAALARLKVRAWEPMGCAGRSCCWCGPVQRVCQRVLTVSPRTMHVLPQVFEGVPPPFDKKKRMVVPEALRITRLKCVRRPPARGAVRGPLRGVAWLLAGCAVPCHL